MGNKNFEEAIVRLENQVTTLRLEIKAYQENYLK